MSKYDLNDAYRENTSLLFNVVVHSCLREREGRERERGERERGLRQREGERERGERERGGRQREGEREKGDAHSTSGPNLH